MKPKTAPDTIWLVSTELKHGQGGISTALLGFIQSETLSSDKLNIITSHSGHAKYRLWIKSLWQVLTKVKSQDTIWLHCGNWFSTLRKITIAIAAKAKGAKVIFHLHEPMDKPIQQWWYQRLIKSVDYLADGLIFLTPWGCSLVESKVSLSAKTAIIANPVDVVCLKHISKARSYKQKSKIINVLSMARIEKSKGFDLVVRTAKYLPEQYHLTIAGDGPYLAQLKKDIKSSDLSHKITCLGWVSYENKHEIFEASDVFFLPTKLDSFGMCFIEAMSIGLPIVALDFGAIPYVVKHEITGFLSDSECPQQLAKSIEQAYIKREHLGVNGKKHVKEQFCPELMSLKLLTFIKEL